MSSMPKYGFSNNPFHYLGKYKTTQRPRVCQYCTQAAYYYHPDWAWCCASHLLDLVNIGGMAFSWEEYPEVWARTERLLQREPREFGTAKNMAVDTPYAVTEDESLDGLMDSYE